MTNSKPWLDLYPSGVPVNIDPDKYDSVISMVEKAFKDFADKPAFTNLGKTITYNQLDKKSNLFGSYLHSRGLQPGDKIALMMPNLLQYPIALFGALRAGLIIVNTNPLYTPREMEHQFTDSDVKAIVICENFAKNLEKVLPKTNIQTMIITSIGELLGFPKANIVNFVIRTIKRMVPKYNLPNTVTFKQALADGKKFNLPKFERCGDDVILHQYTGGTTGVSKGAMLTNRNLIANLLQIREWMAPQIEDGDSISFSPLPMYHIFAFSVNSLALLSKGTHTILITNPRDMPKLVKEFDKYKPNILTGVNTLFNGMLNNKKFKSLDFSNLKITIGGGMAVQRAVAEKWQKVTKTPLSEGYGMTESSPVASVNPIDGTGRIGTIGLPVPSTNMRIVNEQGHPISAGEVGEIQIQGPQVMKGYYNRPEETAKTITPDGWLNTGDIGIMEKDGFFRIVDRKKDMILVSGFNVYPNEIEDVIAMMPEVDEVAAIGIPDEHSGEVVKVFIVKKDKSLKEKAIIAHCKENLTGYKRPKQIEFRKELPKSNVGKILRRLLREENS